MTTGTIIRIIAALVRREAQLLVSCRTITTIAVLAPLFFSLFYGTIYLKKTETQVPIAVVDEDRSTLSREMIRDLDGHQMMAVTEIASDIDAAFHRFRRLDVQGIVYIPAGFQRGLARGEGADLKVYLNASRFLVANDINKAVTETAATIGAGVRLRYLQARGYSERQAMALVEPLRTDLRPVFNTTDTYGDFLLPGVLMLILQQTFLFSLSQSIGREREKKTLAELLRAAGGDTRLAMIGKGTFYLLLFGVYTMFVFAVVFSFMRLPLTGSLSALIALTVLFFLTVAAVTLWVGTYFPTEVSAFQTTLFTSYPIFLFTGYSWPLQSMPALLKGVAVLLPTTPFLQGIIRLTRRGGGWGEIGTQMLHLAVLLIVAAVAAGYRWRRMMADAVPPTSS